jgi:hypothetical protein
VSARLATVDSESRDIGNGENLRRTSLIRLSSTAHKKTQPETDCVLISSIGVSVTTGYSADETGGRDAQHGVGFYDFHRWAFRNTHDVASLF